MKTASAAAPAPPAWGLELLACPGCRAGLSLDGPRLLCEDCGPVGCCEQGVVRFSVCEADSAIAMYEAANGTILYERQQIPFTTSSLDAPVYRSYMEELRPGSPSAVVLDAGAGDGRNTHAWLDWGYGRVVATDAILAPLVRLRERIAAQQPQWLDRLLLIQCDVRGLPLRDAACDLVLAIEVLCLLEHEYEAGVAEAARVLCAGGRLLISDYASEGGLLSRLLYGGIDGLLDVDRAGTLPFVREGAETRLRLLTAAQLRQILEGAGLELVWDRGLSALAPLMGFLRGQGIVTPADERRLPEVVDLMTRIGRTGHMRRTHVMAAEKPAGRLARERVA